MHACDRVENESERNRYRCTVLSGIGCWCLEWKVALAKLAYFDVLSPKLMIIFNTPQRCG